MNALFVALVVLVLLIWREWRDDKYLLVTAFLVGLSMTHNMSSGLLLPAGLLFVLLVEPRKLVEWRLVLKGGGLFLVGLLPYVLLPIRARTDAPLILAPAGWREPWGPQYGLSCAARALDNLSNWPAPTSLASTPRRGSAARGTSTAPVGCAYRGARASGA